MIPPDVERFIVRAFHPADQDQARAGLNTATLHDGSPPGPRLIRCAAVASGGSLDRLRMELETLTRDYRDVIVEAEYIVKGSRLVKVRDLSNPIPEDG
jgi:hypothetical protein